MHTRTHATTFFKTLFFSFRTLRSHDTSSNSNKFICRAIRLTKFRESMGHLWTTLISYSPLLLLFIGILRTYALIDIAHARLPISISQLLTEGGALKIG
ncbi:hypothetical protein Y032_0014g2260 [Ancylostoma ceylanicum]|uniref:Uncharacterized protein n=1 Tax=Ancylostoma ceylanicum TaxID=53326 RepID=A0A016V9Q5_9BILA|nr:hypothetical protein Y032_0014g2260 [Ancylostoma ceylanicum]